MFVPGVPEVLGDGFNEIFKEKNNHMGIHNQKSSQAWVKCKKNPGPYMIKGRVHTFLTW